MLKKFPSDKINGAKYALFILSRVPAHQSFAFDLRFLYDMKHKVRLSKTVCGIFHFQSRFVFMSLYFCLTKCMDSLTLKRHDSFQNENNRKVTQVCFQNSDFQFTTRNFRIQ